LRPDGPYNPGEHAPRFGLIRVRSPLLAESLTCFLFLEVLRWFTSLRCLPRPYVFRSGYSGINRSGFPHSDIPGSKPACGSPGLIAACHVLHRLLVPRHSPYALSSLTKCLLTHCVCVIKELPIAGYSVVKELRSFSAVSCQRDRLREIIGSILLLTADRRQLTAWSEAVENTGLEPVTSWLQTRRSPS
jgi:hypothetical protein